VDEVDAQRGVHEEGLRLLGRRGASGGVPHMADARGACRFQKGIGGGWALVGAALAGGSGGARQARLAAALPRRPERTAGAGTGRRSKARGNGQERAARGPPLSASSWLWLLNTSLTRPLALYSKNLRQSVVTMPAAGGPGQEGGVVEQRSGSPEQQAVC
jgi:hypothetical protein